jgi:hypothetical protein
MKKLSTIKAVILTSVAFAPVLAFAQGVNDVARGIGTFAGLVDGVTQTVVKSVASLLLALAILAFFYGIVEYIWAKRKGDTKGVTDGNKFMTGGLIALFVMFSVYGIIKFAQSTIFGSADMTSISIPNINFKAGGGTGNTTAPGAPSSPGDQYTIPTPSSPGDQYTAPNPSAGAGADCTTDSECTGNGQICIDYKCVVGAGD